LKKHRIKKPPIPVAQIARALGAEVRYSPFDGELAGMLVRGEGETIIGVNSLHHPYRQRLRSHTSAGISCFTTRPVRTARSASFMAREHVYSDPDWLTGGRLEAKLTVTRAPGARHASVRFVTGGLDLVADRAAFLDLAQQAKAPILAIYGDQTPAKSRAEMEALSALPNVSVKRLPIGKLSVHEEFPDAVAQVIMPFLSE
jgi:pimeloyl-ACP methyl ester carboxylesterase